MFKYELGQYTHKELVSMQKQLEEEIERRAEAQRDVLLDAFTSIMMEVEDKLPTDLYGICELYADGVKAARIREIFVKGDNNAENI